MDLRRKTSISEVEDIQIDRRWVPITPVKAAVPKPQPIYENKQEKQLNEENSFETERISWENQLQEEDCLDSEYPPGFSTQSGVNREVACSDSTNGVDLTSDFENWEAGLAENPQIFDGNAAVYDKFSLERWNHVNVTFADLLALADAAKPSSANRTRQENVSATDCTGDVPQYGNSIPTQLNYDLNSPPGTTRDAGPSRTINPQFAPVTPDQAKRAENKQVSDLQSTSANEMTNQTRDGLGNEVATTRVEVSDIHGQKGQPPMLEESSCAAGSTQLEEIHNPDNGGEQGIDLNKTPDQKPRRRKHRPKVVIEGQPKRTRKPRTPKPAVPNEHPTGKRKYVRKKGLEKKSSTPSVGVTGGNTEPKIAENTEKSCRRSLNFDLETQGGDTEPKIAENTEKSCRRSLDFEFETYLRERSSNLNSESQAQNFSTGVQSKPTVQLGQGIGMPVEKTKMGIAYDLTRSMNKVLEGYISMPERQTPTPSTPTKADPPREKLKDDLTNELTRGKCRIVFSNETHDKQEHVIQGSPNDSNCSSSACLTNGEQSRGQKRAHSCMVDEAQLSSMNVTGINYNALQAYLMVPVIDHNNRSHSLHFPAIYKRKKTEKGQNSATSSTVSTTTAENSMRQSTMCHQNNACTNSFTSKTEWTPTKVAAINSTQNNQKALEYMMAMTHTERLTKKRSKGPTQVRDLASRVGTVEYVQWPSFTAIGAPASSNIQGFEASSQQPHICMEAQVAETRPTMATKRRRNSHVNSVPPSTYNHHQSFSKSKVNAGALSRAISRNMSPIGAIVEYLKRLDINGPSKEVAYQEQNALVPYNRRYQDQNALVLYRMAGTVVPFEGSFKKRRPRAKVDLDDETNRVWKLLLENINSEGIDGTDEQKARWWEEERKVFHGRADSFIARMHLVQGDRRFSKWKGSVVDSVVGVFLTQNVSDHLSSSAFMSLAARFPLKSKSGHISCSEDRNGITVEEPDICILEPEDTIKWHEEKLKHTVCDQSSMTLHDVAYNEEKVVNSNETFGSNTGGVRSTNNSRCEALESSGNETIIEDEREVDSPQNSIVSSQNSVDSSAVPPAERIGSCSQSNSEDVTAGPSTKRLDCSTSFMELLKMAGSTMVQGVHNHVTGNVSPYKDGHNQAKSKGCGVECFHIEEDSRFSELVKKKEENYTSEQSGLTTESINQPKVQETLTVSYEEGPPNFNSVQREVNKRIHSQSMPADKPKINNESQTQEHSSQMQKVTESIVDNSKGKRGRLGKEKQNNVEWDFLRKEAQSNGKKRERTANTMDSVDWEAVRCVDVNEIANAIRERGMNNMLAERIKDFLNRIVREHGSIDLEWLRDVPPDKAKEYLLSIRGLGLKSVECVRLLTLHHLAFPVDTNVGRIAVRLGWVPLQPLPESLQLHLLELYPVLESIQRYLWPRLCKLDQRTLYELHYQMITFGKVFCTKSKPNCNACPMRGECRHFASAFASARLALPGPEENSIVCAPEHKAANQNPVGIINPLQLPQPQPQPQPQANQQPKALCQIKNREPIIEEPASPEPIIEEPVTPEPEHPQIVESSIEDIGCEDPEEIPTIRLNIKEFTQNLQNYMQHNLELQVGDVSKALVALTPEVASLPVPKLKNMSRLRTEHQVYELPDSHPLLEGLDRREPDDPCSYLLAIWTPGETATSIQPPEGRCSSQDFGKLCDQHTCFSCNSIREANSQTVRGTLLIPCRTAMRGSFPLNGTYFQVNEVFADHDSSINPIDVPRAWIWNLPRRTVYFGTSIPTIFKGLSTEGIQYCFWRGFVCVRGFDQKTRAPRPLMARLHFPASKLTKTQGKTDDK